MATKRRLLDESHQRRLFALRVVVGRRIEALYRTLDPADLDEAFATRAAAAAAVIAAAQAVAVTMAAAHARSLLAATEKAVEVEPQPPDLIGRTEKGVPLIEGMAAFAAMVKARIAAGATVPDALEFGRYLATRFADAEVVRAADETTRSMTTSTPLFRGWVGNVDKDACDPCRGNEGEHPLTADLYRHPGCRCWQEWIAA